MRIKLNLENEAGIRRRKLWHLIDETCCAKVADVVYLINKRFYNCKGNISLSLDGFTLPPQEDINIIRDNDEITVKIIRQEPSTSSESSSSESENEIQFKKKISSKVLPSHQRKKDVIPIVKTTIVKKNKHNTPCAVLKKITKTIPVNPLQNVNALKKTVANVLAKTNTNKLLPNKVISKPATKNVPVSNTRNKSSSDDSSDTSSSSSDDETTPVIKKKVPPSNGKPNGVPAGKPSKPNVVPVSKPSKPNIVPVSKPSKPNVVPASKPNKLVRNTTKKVSSSDSSDSSSSSDDEAEPVKKKTCLTKKLGSNGQAKKTIPLSQLGVRNSTKKDSSDDSSDTSDSSDENNAQRKKSLVSSINKKEVASNKMVPNRKGVKKVTPSNSSTAKASSSGSSEDSSASSSDEGPDIINKKKNALSNGKVPIKSTLTAVKQFLDGMKTGNIDSKNSNCFSVHESKKNNEKLCSSVSKGKNDAVNTSLNTSGHANNMKKDNKVVDFQVSQILKDKESPAVVGIGCMNNDRKSSTPDNSKTNNRDFNNSFGSSAKAKRQLSRDVYKNTSQFIRSKSEPPTTLMNGKENDDLDFGDVNDSFLPKSGCTSGRSDANDSFLPKSDCTSGRSDANDSFLPKTDCTSGRSERRKRRAKTRRENKRKRELAKAEDNESNLEPSNVEKQIPARDDSIEGITEPPVIASGIPCKIPVRDYDSLESVTVPPDDVGTQIADKMPARDYDSFESITVPPDVGSKIAYKILEMDAITYTPKVSEYKEALIKSFNKETNTLELELSEESQTKDIGDCFVGGKFEMPVMSDEENQTDEVQKQLFVNWIELLEPRLLGLADT